MYTRRFRYICFNCCEVYDIFEDEHSDTDNFPCPKCGKKLFSHTWFNVDKETGGVEPYTYRDNGEIISHKEMRDKEIERERAEASKVHCFYCNSTDVKKISASSRWLSTGLFGLSSKKLGKEWHCNNCGSNF